MLSSKTIVLPIGKDIYEDFLKEKSVAHEIIQDIYESEPDFFPMEMKKFGYSLNGFTRTSKKQDDFKMRQLLINDTTYRIRPSFMLSYCRGLVSEASDGLFLKRFGVPYWALEEVFGQDKMWWYRLYISIAKHEIVGTTVYEAEDLPEDLIADEHHIRVKGKKKYVATTVGGNCFLGMAVCDGADEKSLLSGYEDFKNEACLIEEGYIPNSINTDGWMATQNAWKKMFPTIQVIECFLHAFLKVRDRATKKMEEFFQTAADKIWDAYRAESKRQLAQQIRRLREWASTKLEDSPMKQNILKLCSKKARWMKHFDFKNAHRTSNMLDRLMRSMKRHKFNAQMFHSTTKVTTDNFRSFALIYNFSPYSPSARKENKEFRSPADKLNKRKFSDNWLENLFLAANRAKFKYHCNPI